jgi:hypothetical protein
MTRNLSTISNKLKSPFLLINSMKVIDLRKLLSKNIKRRLLTNRSQKKMVKPSLVKLKANLEPSIP